MCCGGGLAEENYQCGVIYVVRIRKVTSFSLESRHIIPHKGGGVDVERCGSQLIGLNLLISIIAWDES